MFAGDPAQGQLVDVKVAGRRPQDGVLFDLANAGIQATGDPARDFELDLRNLRGTRGEAVSPGNAAVARVDKLNVDDHRSVSAPGGALDEIARAELLAELLRHQVLVGERKGGVAADQA